MWFQKESTPTRRRVVEKLFQVDGMSLKAKFFKVRGKGLTGIFQGGGGEGSKQKIFYG